MRREADQKAKEQAAMDVMGKSAKQTNDADITAAFDANDDEDVVF